MKSFNIPNRNGPLIPRSPPKVRSIPLDRHTLRNPQDRRTNIRQLGNVLPHGPRGHERLRNATVGPRHEDGEVYCGIYADVEEPGHVCVGDEVEPLEDA